MVHLAWQETFKQEVRHIAEVVIDTGQEYTGELILAGVVGTAAPGVMDAVLAYKQKRQEHMYLKFVEEMQTRAAILEDKMRQLSAFSLHNFKEKYFGMISDYALEEVQEEKIKYLVSGLIEVASHEDANEDQILNYYDTLLDLRISDIAVLKNFALLRTGDGMIGTRLCPMLGIDQNQYKAIKHKLERMGLVTTNRIEQEDRLYHNIKVMQAYLDELDKGRNQPRLKSFERLDDRENTIISRYGTEFLQFFDA